MFGKIVSGAMRKVIAIVLILLCNFVVALHLINALRALHLNDGSNSMDYIDLELKSAFGFLVISVAWSLLFIITNNLTNKRKSRNDEKES